MGISKYNENLTLDYLTSHPEDSNYDRKSARKDYKSLANTITSFANANGGVVAVGIEDDGKITGFQNIGDEKFKGFQKVLSSSYFKTIPKCKVEIRTR